MRSHKTLKNVEISLGQLWLKCKAIAEPVLGTVEVSSKSYLDDELEKLCTRLVGEANRWKAKCSQDSLQETTLVLADSFREFRTADLELQEVEPKVSTHAEVLDNWHMYCGRIHEEEQTARTKMHHLLI